MRMQLLRLLALVGLAGTSWAQPPLAEGGDAPAGPVTVIGTSREGRPIGVITLSTGGDADAKPALAIVAGLDARHLVGVEVSQAVARTLMAEHAELLERYTVYVIANANPDGVARIRSAGRGALDWGGSLTPRDDDRDRRVDEDGPRDINGDGVISMMRIERPGPGTGLSRTHVIDKDDPRLMRAPDAEKGEVATHAVIVEGVDADGDGRVAEDGAGGVDLDRNFPSFWPELATDSGAYPLSEPETRAIADWMLARTNIVALIVYGPQDTIVNVPQSGRMDPTGRIPLGIEEGDRQAYELVNKVFKEATKIKEAPTGGNEGSLQGWAYAHLGILSFETPVWVRPDQMEVEAAKAEGGEGGGDAPQGQSPEDERAALLAQGVPARVVEFLLATPERQRQMMQEVMSAPPEEQARMQQEMQGLPAEIRQRVVMRVQALQAGAGDEARPAQPAARPEGGRGRGGQRGNRGGGGGGGAPAGGGDDAKWLKLVDERGEGFVEWQPFEHPTLGRVEIGGFEPGFKFNPPPGEIERLASEQAAVVAGILSRMAHATVEEPEVEDLGGGLWRISVRVGNEAELPTRLAIGAKAGRRIPMRLELMLPQERVVSGQRLTRMQRLEGLGGSRTVQWIVLGEAGSTVELKVTSLEFGVQTHTVTLGGQER